MVWDICFTDFLLVFSIFQKKKKKIRKTLPPPPFKKKSWKRRRRTKPKTEKNYKLIKKKP